MTDLLLTFPWPETGVSAAVGLVAGFAMGFFAGSRREKERAS